MIISNSFPDFKDIDGTALQNGSVFIGEIDKNPETNPISVFWDVDLIQPASQPLKTVNGYIVRDGKMANVYTEENYSITVKNKKDVLLFYVADSGKVNFSAYQIKYKNETVGNALDCRLPEIANYAALRLYSNVETAFYVRGYANIFDGGFGVFRVDPSDFTSSDDDCTIIIDALNRRWKRIFVGAYNVLWAGADRSGVNLSQSAFDKVKGTGNRDIYFPSGTYKVSNISLPTYSRAFGDGYDSVLISDGSVNHVITLNYVHHCRIDNLRIKGNAGKTNLCGIYGNGAVWTELENLIVENNGSHGIQFTDTGTAYLGSYPVMCSNVHSRYNLGDGYNQVATSGNNQQNAIYIKNSEFQGNVGNGLTLWGTRITMRDSVSEGNTGYGIKIDNGLTSGSSYSASSICLTDNYFELNTAGHIRVRVGTYGAIQQFTIEDNYLSSNSTILGVGYKPVSVDNYSSGANLIRNLSFKRNVNQISGTDLTAYADFGNALNADSFIEPYFASLTATDIVTVPSKYINIGYARLKFVQNATANGYFRAKGGSGITYSNPLTGSDNITVSGSSTNFHMEIPIGSKLFFAAVPVQTDSTNYAVTLSLYSRQYDATNVTTNATLIATMPMSGMSGPQLVKSSTLESYVSGTNYLASSTNMDFVLKITVTWVSPGTFFYLGSPTIYYAAP